MKDIILKVENISKQYRLGLIGTGTITHDFNRWWHRVRGKDDPYLRIGEANDRSKKGESDYVWALKDINFEVEKGEVLGIIGKNGAGKSTLLKILSKVTGPTTGEIKTRGRIASLLEVGTGFHREMTGRENIYLNGAILGMTKKEIHSKIEEIIEFSGCERYIDTPVKRYSSGMTVRLAFAVAAFLEPEILVIDEVLAVGDAEFQKKAIGKMQDISKGQGRTVLFVSHNMAAIQDLCSKVIILENGTQVFEGSVEEGVNKYLTSNLIQKGNLNFENHNTESTKGYIKSFKIKNYSNDVVNSFYSGDDMIFEIELFANQNLINPILSLRISDFNNKNLLTWRSNDYIESPLKVMKDKTTVKIECNNLFLLNGVYSLSIGYGDGKEPIDVKQNFIDFEIFPANYNDKFNSITKEKSSNSMIYHEAKWSIK